MGGETWTASVTPIAVQEQSDSLEKLPTNFLLSQNYPNPFNPETRIDYQIPRAGDVEIIIYDILGRQVLKLVHGHREAGRYSAIWDGRDERRVSLGSGIYVVRMRAGNFSASHKVILVH